MLDIFHGINEKNVDFCHMHNDTQIVALYLLTILPRGVVSKNDIGARTILSSNRACSIPAALTPPM